MCSKSESNNVWVFAAFRSPSSTAGPRTLADQFPALPATFEKQNALATAYFGLRHLPESPG